jgi:predicted outer membrane repeat protein
LRSSGTLTILDSTITANTKTGNGGGIENGGVLNLVRTTVNGNSASVYGGGIYHQSASPALLVNVTLSGNHGGVAGGAIAIQNPTGTFTTTTVTVYNSTIVTNTAPLSGGGIFSYALGGKIYINLYQNILSGNRANNSIGNEFRQANGSGGSHEIVRAYNILGDAGETANQAFVNPLFPGPTDRNATSSGTPAAFNTIVVPLLNNNGIHPHPDTHALPVGSPAIDFAPSAVCLASPVSNFDARTGFRNINGVGGDTANECDSGAYEFGATPNPTAVELSGLRASPTKTILPIALALALLLASLVSLAFWRKNRQV